MRAPGPATEVSLPGPADGTRRIPELAHDPDRVPEDVPPFEVLHDGDRVVLLGTVDSFTADRLAGQLPTDPSAPVSILDLTGLEFLDVAGCRVLARWAYTVCPPPSRVRVVGSPRIVERMWHLLGLDEVAPMTFTEGRR